MLCQPGILYIMRFFYCCLPGTKDGIRRRFSFANSVTDTTVIDLIGRVALGPAVTPAAARVNILQLGATLK